MPRLGLSSPWDIRYKEFVTLFKNDKEIQIIYDDENKEIILNTANQSKASALMKLLPTEYNFGNVVLKIKVNGNMYSNTSNSIENLFMDAFKDNNALEYVKTIQGVFKITYIVFKKDVVQYFTDSLSDIHGNTSTLYETIARNIFKENEGVYYCTDNSTSSITLLSSSGIF